MIHTIPVAMSSIPKSAIVPPTALSASLRSWRVTSPVRKSPARDARWNRVNAAATAASADRTSNTVRAVARPLSALGCTAGVYP
jgi:hypothetical protein